MMGPGESGKIGRGDRLNSEQTGDRPNEVASYSWHRGDWLPGYDPTEQPRHCVLQAS
jgi:hypothetical protein